MALPRSVLDAEDGQGDPLVADPARRRRRRRRRASSACRSSLAAVARRRRLRRRPCCLAMPRPAPKPPTVDPFTVGEPWRHFVQAASAPGGASPRPSSNARPVRCTTGCSDIADRLDAGLRRGLGSRQARPRDRRRHPRPRPDAACARGSTRCSRRPTTAPTANLAAADRARSSSQLASADRLKQLSASTADQLRLTEARLDELCARAAEVSVGTQRHRPLRPRRRRPRARARGPAPGACRSCRADVTAKRIVRGARRRRALIVAALVVRRTVLDDDDDASAGPTRRAATTPPPTAATELVCSHRAGRAVPRRSRRRIPELDVSRSSRPATTLDALARSATTRRRPLWLTLQPFPAMVDVAAHGHRTGSARLHHRRRSARRSSPSPRRRAGGPRRWPRGAPDAPLWRCIGDHAGAPWTDLGGDAAVAHDPSVARRRRARGRRAGVVRRRRRRLRRHAAISRGSAWQDDPAFIAVAAPAGRRRRRRRPSRPARRWPRWRRAPARSTSPRPPTPSVARPRCHGRSLRRQLP